MSPKSHLTYIYAIAVLAMGMSVFGLIELFQVHNEINNLANKNNTGAVAAAVIGAPEAGGPIPATSASATVTSAKTQDQLLTSAVAKTAPAVVSIVISKAVPDLEVTYVNPFGNDPLFDKIGLEIPEYHNKGTTEQKVGAGSGFIISKNGYILTNQHVVSDPSADYTVLLSDGTQKTATVVYRDPTDDIAVLKIPGTYASVALFGNSSDLKLGSTVIAIGNALGEYSNSVSVGIVSGLNRDIQATDPEGGSEDLTGMIQTDASINPGNSGGPLLDLSGNVVAMNVATVYGSNNIGFSIPIDAIKSIVAKYI